MRHVRTIGALLAALLWIFGMSALPAEAAGFRGGGFGGFRGGGGFGGFRSGGGGFRGFGGFRSTPRSPGGFGGFGGFRARPRAPEPGVGGFGGVRSTPTAPPSAPIEAAPPGTPRLGTVPAPTPAPSRPGGPSSSIATPLPSARPSTGPQAPGGSPASGGPPSSIATPLPSAQPRAPGSSGLRFSTRERPGALPPAAPVPDYRRGWGRVYMPTGYGYWHVAPYHWLWWLGWPNPYPMYGPVHHAGLGIALFATLLMGLVVVGIGAAIYFFVRRSAGGWA